jgi:hypothetical protein
LSRYDEPVVTGVSPNHGPTGGGSKITVLGKNFGVQDSRPTVSVGHTPCTLTVWQSDSSIVCTVPAGQGHDHLIEATIIGAHSKENALVRFSFDSPVVSAVSPSNIPPTDAIALTLYGEAFGGPDSVLNAFIGATKCLKTSWVSSTALTCTTPAGTGAAKNVILVAGDSSYPIASAAELSEGHVARVSYDAPQITAIVRTSGATSGAAELTLMGRNFGGKPQNVRVSVGGTSCLNANWQSDAEVTCRLSPGTGSNNLVVLSLDGQTSPSHVAAADGGAYTPIVAFPPPTMSSISPSVGKPQGGVLVTVEGANFGIDKSKVQVFFGKHAGKVLRAEESNLLVLSPAGEGEDELKVTVDGQESTLTGPAEHALFRYDGPSITSLSVNHGPTVGGTVIDIAGSNLGANGLQLAITVGGIPCISVMWISSSSAQCTSPPGVGGSHMIEMSIDGTARANSGAFRFSYDRPIIESVEPSFFSESGGDRVAILGRNFGEVEGRASQMIVQVGRTQCAQTRWVSDAELDCTTPPGPLGDAAVTVRISGQASLPYTVQRVKPGAAAPLPPRAPPPPATPAPPAAGIIGIKPDHASPSGGDLISIFGTGFNARDGEPEVAFGRFGCYESQTVSSSEVVCRLPTGVGSALRPSVSYPGQPVILGPANVLFSYNAPIVTSVSPSKGSVLGGDMITMGGSNFGNGLSDIKGFVGENACLESSYVSDSEITCLTPHGSSHPQPLFVQAGDQRGTVSRANFVFVGRMIDSVTPDHMRTAGGGRVVIKSANFVKSDFADVLIGGKRCNSTHWQSLNALSCMVPAGVGGNLDVSVQLGNDVWNGFGSFSYDAATVLRVDPSEAPSAGQAPLRAVRPSPILLPHDSPLFSPGNVPVSVYGRNFGHSDADPTVFIGRSACSSTFYFSDELIMCIVPPGGGLHLPVTVSVGAQHVLTSAAVFDYESPIVASITPSVGPSYGGSVITVTGSGFGTSADGATVYVGNEPCEASSWVSDSQMLCVSPRIALEASSSAEETDSSAGEGLAVTVHVFNQSSRSSATFVPSADEVSQTEINPGFGHPGKQKRGPFYVSVAYILAIALAAAVLLLGRHLMKRPAASSLLSSYTGVSASAFHPDVPSLPPARDIDSLMRLLPAPGFPRGQRRRLSPSRSRRVVFAGHTAGGGRSLLWITRVAGAGERWCAAQCVVVGESVRRQSPGPGSLAGIGVRGSCCVFCSGYGA